MSFAIEVRGVPAPKGSMRAVIMRGRAQVIPGGSKANKRAQHAWVKAIQGCVDVALGGVHRPLYVLSPLEVHLLFKLVRPANHYGSKRGTRYLKSDSPLHPMAQRDDIDKLARAVLDALTGLLYDDDGRIVTLVCTKQYVDHEAAQGVVITIDRMPVSLQQALPTAQNVWPFSSDTAKLS